MAKKTSPKKAAKSQLKKFSVLLLYPEHLAGFHGESYYTHVKAKSYESAIKIARKEVAESNDYDSAEDFVVLLVTTGHCPAL